MNNRYNSLMSLLAFEKDCLRREVKAAESAGDLDGMTEAVSVAVLITRFQGMTEMAEQAYLQHKGLVK